MVNKQISLTCLLCIIQCFKSQNKLHEVQLAKRIQQESDCKETGTFSFSRVWLQEGSQTWCVYLSLPSVSCFAAPQLGGSGQLLVGNLKGALLRGTGMFPCGNERRSLGRPVSRDSQELGSLTIGGRMSLQAE